MARRLRVAAAGMAYHVLNRRVGRLELFSDDGDYAAFERILGECHERCGISLLCYCLMPNHWHLVLWPEKPGQLSTYMQWLTTTHTRRWHAHRASVGSGPLYQGRFKSFPIQDDQHLLTVCRYVERNAVRANLAPQAQQWRWSSIWKRCQAQPPWLLDSDRWPVEMPANWVGLVNRPQSRREQEALRTSVARGAPFGDEAWVARTARRLKLESALRPPWRPRKERKESDDDVRRRK